MKTKTCTKCYKIKLISKFYKRKDSKKEYRSWCKECIKEYRKKYYLDNKEKLNKNAEKWRKNNQQKINTQHRKHYQTHKKEIKEYQEKWRQEHLWAISYSSAKQRCNNPKHKKYKYYGGRGIMFLMTVKDFKFLWFRDKAYLMEKPSIDRKNNNGNYTLKNCQFIELRKNRSKDNRGENNSNTKLTKKQVIKIRNLYKTKKYTYQLT